MRRALTLDVITARRYGSEVIASFRCADTEKVLSREAVRKFSLPLQKTARRKLISLDEAEELIDLASPPGNRLEALKGRRKGQHSIRINDQWRICFRWKNNRAHDVEIVDYH
jgi:proteic killer suppression protein